LIEKSRSCQKRQQSTGVGHSALEGTRGGEKHQRGGAVGKSAKRNTERLLDKRERGPSKQVATESEFAALSELMMGIILEERGATGKDTPRQRTHSTVGHSYLH